LVSLFGDSLLFAFSFAAGAALSVEDEEEEEDDDDEDSSFDDPPPLFFGFDGEDEDVAGLDPFL
jgi:hypothetical protein